MKCTLGAVVLVWMLHTCAAKPSLQAVEPVDFHGNVSQFVDYSSFEEEDKQFTLMKLTEETPDFGTTEAEEITTPEYSEPAKNMTIRDGRVFPVALASAGQFPYYVYVMATQKDGSTIEHCGGALISDTWVLTAAQYVATASKIEVIAGLIASATTSPSSFGTAHVHPGYMQNFLIHNIALIRLQTPFALTANIFPIKLTKKETKDLNSVTVRTVGFGHPDNTATGVVDDLGYVDLVQLSKAACRMQSLEIFVEYSHNVACLSTSTSSRGFCYGDIGGPVVYTFPNDVSISLIGINSQFQACPSAYPMTYTRVFPYIPWIKSKVKKLLT